MKSKIFFWRRIVSLIADLTLIYSFSIALKTVIWSFTYLPPEMIFMATLITYYILFALLFKGQTPGRFITGLTLTTQGSNRLTTKP